MANIDDCIDVWLGCIPEILAAARKSPSLQLRVWAKQLDEFEERKRAKQGAA